MNRYKFIDENKEHLHTLDGKPLIGTTTALSIISKELTWWASGMACAEFGWLNPKKNKSEDCEHEAIKGQQKIKAMAESEYIYFLNKAYRAHNDFKEKRAGEGTDLHDLAEQLIKWKMEGLEPLLIDPRLKSFFEWTEKNVKRFLFSEIHCYSERLWVGGKTDFGYEDMEGNYVLADIKSRDKDYFSDHVQCGGYDIQLQTSNGLDKDGNLIWKEETDKWFKHHAIFTLGDKFKEPVFSDPEDNRNAFECALGLYKLKQAYEEKT